MKRRLASAAALMPVAAPAFAIGPTGGDPVAALKGSGRRHGEALWRK